MTTICPRPPSQGKTSSLNLLVREPIISPNFQSLERQKIAEFTQEIWVKLTISGREIVNSENLKEIDYKPVPPKRTFTVRARYQFKGRIEPQPYQLEDE